MNTLLHFSVWDEFTPVWMKVRRLLTKKKQRRLEGILRHLWWMSWLQFTTCKRALPTCHIFNPLAILRLWVEAVCLFSSPFPHLCRSSPARITTFFRFPISAASSGAKIDECRSHYSDLLDNPSFLSKENSSGRDGRPQGWVIQHSRWVFVTEASDGQILVSSEKDRYVLLLELLQPHRLSQDKHTLYKYTNRQLC